MGNEFTNKILKLALPITAQQFMLALVSACDAFMLGGLNQNSLSEISLASQITFVFNLILTAWIMDFRWSCLLAVYKAIQTKTVHHCLYLKCRNLPCEVCKVKRYNRETLEPGQ